MCTANPDKPTYKTVLENCMIQFVCNFELKETVKSSNGDKQMISHLQSLTIKQSHHIIEFTLTCIVKKLDGVSPHFGYIVYTYNKYV